MRNGLPLRLALYPSAVDAASVESGIGGFLWRKHRCVPPRHHALGESVKLGAQWLAIKRAALDAVIAEWRDCDASP